MSTIYTIGEALIDFIPMQTGLPLKDVSGFEKRAGGAPANVASAVAKLGGRSSFIGMLGKDAFGDFLQDTLRSVGVETKYVYRTDEAQTSLAFVSLSKNGNRDFSFYRNPGADMLLAEKHVQHIPFHADDMLHFCSVDLIDAPVKHAHKRAIENMIKRGGIVSFDPNIRLPLWSDPQQCLSAVREFLPLAHILKISDEELTFITGIKNEREALASLFTGNVTYLFYTRGAAGAAWVSRTQSVSVSSPKVRAIDTTGAGDAFIGAVLSQLQKRQLRLEAWTEAEAREIVSFANAVAAVTTTRHGAIDAFPFSHEVSLGRKG